MRVEVFSGWIELRDPDLVPERLRRPVFEKSVAGRNLVQEDDANVDERAISFFSDFNDLLAICMIKEWSFEQPISAEGLLDLSGKTYDDIRKTVAPYITKLIPDFGVNPDPKAITENSPE